MHHALQALYKAGADLHARSNHKVTPQVDMQLTCN